MKSNNHIVITAGYDCNSSCIMCVVGSKFHNNNNSTTEEIYSILAEGRRNNAESVEISGGEPTVRKDLPKLISLAKMLGYTRIGITTNGMLLSNNDYCKELIKAGLTYVIFSLHGPNKKISEAITNTPNSFDRTISGIKNAVKNKTVEVVVVTPVQKTNFKHILEIGNLIYSLGVKRWSVCDLVPVGMAKEKYATLSVNRIDLLNTLREIIPLLDKMHILLYNFTQCSVPHNFPVGNIMTMSRKYNQNNFISYDKKGVFKKSTIGDDGTLSKIDICNSCKYSEKCAGFWTDYLNLYGEKDIIKLATTNDCLK